MNDQIICGDCLEIMPTIPDNSVDMVLADLPYGVTACKWDTPIDLDALWAQWLRICNGAIVLTACQPFASKLVMSKPEIFAYDLIMDKSMPTGHLNANRRPLRSHEHILIFNINSVYNPQFTEGLPHHDTKPKPPEKNRIYGKHTPVNKHPSNKKYPRSIIKVNRPQPMEHPSQKPVALFEYLIRTYTDECDTVLDPTCGSGTTAVACHKSNRHYICIEKEPEYCAIAEKRLKEML